MCRQAVYLLLFGLSLLFLPLHLHLFHYNYCKFEEDAHGNPQEDITLIVRPMDPCHGGCTKGILIMPRDYKTYKVWVLYILAL